MGNLPTVNIWVFNYIFLPDKYYFMKVDTGDYNIIGKYVYKYLYHLPTSSNK